MNPNFNGRLTALIHDIEGDQPPPLDHYRYEVSTLPDGKTCVTLYGPEGHESNALSWYQRLGIEWVFPDTWQYVVVNSKFVHPREIQIGDQIRYINENYRSTLWTVIDIIFWGSNVGKKLILQSGDIIEYFGFREDIPFDGQLELVFRPHVPTLDPTDIDYDWRADDNEYPFDTQVQETKPMATEITDTAWGAARLFEDV